MDVRFSPDNRTVVSVGGRDRAILQWRVDKQGVDKVVRDAEPLPEVYIFEPPRRTVPDIQPAGVMPVGHRGLRQIFRYRACAY